MDYKEMYYVLMDATERAIEILIEAQRKCEEMYMEAEEPKIISVVSPTEEK